MQNQIFASLRDADGDTTVLTEPAHSRPAISSDAISVLRDMVTAAGHENRNIRYWMR